MMTATATGMRMAIIKPTAEKRTLQRLESSFSYMNSINSHHKTFKSVDYSKKNPNCSIETEKLLKHNLQKYCNHFYTNK